MLQETSAIVRFLRQPKRAMLIGGCIVLLLVAVGIAVGIGGCGGERSGGGPAATSQPTTTVATNSDRSEPAPILSLSVNGAMECQTYASWPVTATVVLTHPSRFGIEAPPAKFGSDTRSWTESLKLVIVDAGGKAVQWPIKLTRAEPTGVLELSGDNAGRATWQLSSAESAKLASGRYTLRAALDLEAGGKVESRPVVLRVGAEPAQLSADESSRKQRLLAVEAMKRKDWAAAEKQLDAALAQRPDDIGAWELKGDVLRAQNKLGEAVAAYDSALKAFHRIAKDNYDEPSRSLILKRREAMAQKEGN